MFHLHVVKNKDICFQLIGGATLRIVLGAVMGLCGLAATPVHAAEQPGLCAGVAQLKITPPVGTPMAGYYSKRLAEGTHDDLHVKAIVLQVGDHKAALVALDLIRTLRPVVEKARQLISDQTGIPTHSIMISATHAHTGPVIKTTTARAGVLGGTDPLVAQYVAQLPGAIAKCVVQANARLAPTEITAAVGRETGLAFNRRFHMDDGSIGWNPGRLNPHIVRPAGPVDPDVPFVLLSDSKHNPIGCYVNFAMHLDTVGGVQFSADYPCALAQSLANSVNPQLITLFTIGCAGDINHIDVAWRNRQKGNNEAARIGTRLASAVLRSLETNLHPVTAGKLQIMSKTVALPLAPVSDADISAARDVVKRLVDKTTPRPAFLDQVQAFKVLDIVERHGKPWEVEVQVVTLGRQLAWVSLPGEVFCQLGLAIKRGAPFKQTMIAELANGSIGYIPDHLAYAQGNYEVVSARCADGSGEQLVDAAVAMLRAMYRNATP